MYGHGSNHTADTNGIGSTMADETESAYIRQRTRYRRKCNLAIRIGRRKLYQASYQKIWREHQLRELCPDKIRLHIQRLVY